MNHQTPDMQKSDASVQKSGKQKVINVLLLLISLAIVFFLLPGILAFPAAILIFVLWGRQHKKLDSTTTVWESDIARPLIEEQFPGTGAAFFQASFPADIIKSLEPFPYRRRADFGKGFLNTQINHQTVSMGDIFIGYPSSSSADRPMIAYMIQPVFNTNGILYLSTDKRSMFAPNHPNYTTGDADFDRTFCIYASEAGIADTYLTASTREQLLKLAADDTLVTFYLDSQKMVALTNGTLSYLSSLLKPSLEEYRKQLSHCKHFCEEFSLLAPR